MSKELEFTIIEGIKCYNPEVSSAYTDYPDSGFDLSDENARNSFWVNSRNRLFKRIVQRHLLPKGHTRLLDIGCGTGDFICQLDHNDRIDLTGSEIYLKGLVSAKKKLPSVEFVQFDVAQGNIGAKFHIITAFDVIEHIDDDTAALANINQMLEDEGVLIISVPQHMFLWSRLDEIVKHKRRYSRRELVSKLRTSGFKVSYITSFVFVLFPLMLISRLFDKGRSDSLSDQADLEKRVKFPSVMNRVFDFLMRIDESLIKMGVSLPCGGTLVLVARKQLKSD